MKNPLQNSRLSARLAAGFGLVLALLLLITGLALQRMQRMQAQTQEIVEVSNERVARAQAMMNSANDASVALYGFMLISDEIDAKAQQQLYDGAMARYQAADQAFRALLVEPQLKTLDDAATAAGSFGRNITRTVASGGDVGATLRSMDPRPVLDEWRKEIVNCVAVEREAGKTSYEQAQATFRVARIVLIISALLACALGLVAAWLILRSVTGPLTLAIAHAQRIATGDLRTEIEASSHDETGELMRALAQMQEQLRSVVGAIRTSTQGITMASSEIAQGNLDLSNRTETAASNLEQTAAAVQDLSDTVHKNADSARAAHELVNATSVAAGKGGAVVEQVVSTMGEINARSRQIADITSVIDGIAFQTNILALNAAVEAARAGEQGRGFAVVAGEVRMLAQRAATAAKDIKGLTSGSVDKIVVGSQLAVEAGASMREIVASVERVMAMIGAISTAATEQSTSIGQVNVAITQLDQMTQSNAALVEQSAAAAESLKQQALVLAGVVSSFGLDGDQEDNTDTSHDPISS